MLNIKKQLLIAHEFPPLAGPESIQSSRLVGALSSCGWDSIVLTVKPVSCHNYDQSLVVGAEDENKVIRAKTWESKILKGAAYLLCKPLLYCPDPKIGWYPDALKEGIRAIDEYKPDIIHSWSTPFTSHLVAKKLVEMRKLPWITHFSDPWVDNPYIDYRYKWHRQFNEKLEKQVIEKADSIVFTSDETLELVMRKYPVSWRNKAVVLPHTYDPKQINPGKVGIIEDNDSKAAIKIVHTGHFYGKRTPEDLFIALAAYKKKYGSGRIRFLFVGRVPRPFDSMPKELGIEDMVEYLGVLPYKNTLEIMLSGDILLTIDAPGAEGSIFLPSKLVEYLGCIKPIIGITNPIGTSARLLNKYGHIVVANKDHEAMISLFNRISRDGVNWINFDPKAHEEFTPQAVAANLSVIFDKLRGGRS